MPQSKRTYYPIPEGWREEVSGTEWLALVTICPIGLFLIVHGLRSTEQYRLPTTVFLISSGILFLCFCAFVPVRQLTRDNLHIDTDRMESAPGRTVVGHTHAATATTAGLYGCLIVSGLTLLVGDVLGDLPADTSQGAPAPFIIAGIVVWSVLYLPVFLVNRSVRRITLTPRAITFPRGALPFSTTVAWKDITAIEAIASRGGGLVKLKARSARQYEPRTVCVDARFIAAGAPAMYWLLRFYYDHPECRPELGDGRAVARAGAYELFDRHRDDCVATPS
ncbi:hypothetical protein HLB23_02845 [Nocardia uniformis]|uniref:PH domain-containing protein n=1 Tax=Nocardia uniformis TaxID=53432 RepID=A0A849C765_9NOCA|nr:hypothetical protein [Nocardia uniformis]NNH68821.1 hypothetical protein [Nocardia uniformis]